MNNEKEVVMIRVRVSKNTDVALKKILEIKKITTQALLEKMINDYLLENIDCFLGGK
ncbi:MAG: hypothetical protein PHN42_04625 [Bacilli bacterium]|nr:hypothetical protein [Bacilli bacterium]